MADDNEKYRKFVHEPIGNKPLTAIPGIGALLGKRLRDKGFDKAKKVMAQFVQMGRDTENFKNWLQDTVDAPPYMAELCARALREWCNTHP